MHDCKRPAKNVDSNSFWSQTHANNNRRKKDCPELQRASRDKKLDRIYTDFTWEYYEL